MALLMRQVCLMGLGPNLRWLTVRRRPSWIVHEISLCIVVGGFADDLDAVLVGANGAIGAETQENRLVKTLFAQVELGYLDACVGYIVVDPNGEAILLAAPGIVEHSQDLGGQNSLLERP